MKASRCQTHPLTLLILVISICAGSAKADETSDLSKRAKTFCDTKVRLTEDSIKFDVQKLVTLDASQKSTSALDSESVFEIALMTLNCKLLVTKYISADQFISTQTEILQFAIAVENTRKVAENKAGKETSQKPNGQGIKDIASDLGVKLKQTGGTAQSGAGDYVEQAISKIVTQFSPIRENK